MRNRVMLLFPGEAIAHPAAFPPVAPAAVADPAPAPAAPAPAADPAAPAADPPAPAPVPDPATPADPPAPPADPAKPAETAFTLQLPKDAVLDDAAIERTTAIARESGLSNEQAQKVLELANTEAAATLSEYLEAWKPGDPAKGIEGGAEWSQRVGEWEAAVRADPDLGGAKFDETKRLATLALEKVATPELRGLLHTTGYGSHPEILRLFARLGREASEPQSMVRPPAGVVPDTKSHAKALYPDLPE